MHVGQARAVTHVTVPDCSPKDLLQCALAHPCSGLPIFGLKSCEMHKRPHRRWSVPSCDVRRNLITRQHSRKSERSLVLHLILVTLAGEEIQLPIELQELEAKGGAKASAPEWESGGQRGRKKHGALFGGRGEESFICGSLPGSSCERRERRETERRETERRERERERRER